MKNTSVAALGHLDNAPMMNPDEAANNGIGMGQIDQAGVRARLERLREIFGIETQAAMAARLGLEYQTYYKAETASLSKDVAIRICQRFPGVTLDWLFFGKLDGMPMRLVNTLSGLPA